MASKTLIEWSDSSWNPTRGCRRRSAGCQNCYAETVAARFSGPGQPYEGLIKDTSDGPRWNGEVRFVYKHLLDPIQWSKPRRIFTNSMSDLFFEEFTSSQIDMSVAVMLANAHSPVGRRHLFYTLTKRDERMADYFCSLTQDRIRAAMCSLLDISAGNVTKKLKPVVEWFKHNEFSFDHELIMWGVSIENQDVLPGRMKSLNAMKRMGHPTFVSAEPLLGPLDFSGFLGDDRPNLIIAGAESGNNARQSDKDWYRTIRDQCKDSGVAFFLKQFASSGVKISLPKLDGIQYTEQYNPTGFVEQFAGA